LTFPEAIDDENDAFSYYYVCEPTCPSFMTFTNNLITLFFISTDPSETGEYSFEYYLYEDIRYDGVERKQSGSLYFKVKVKEINYAPSFTEVISDQEITVGETLLVYFPEVTDLNSEDDHSYKVTSDD